MKRVAWALALAVQVVGCARSGCSRAPAPQVGKDLGDLATPAPDAAPLLKLARAIVDHKGGGGATPPPASAASSARRVALVYWKPGSDPLAATAIGQSLSEAVASAAETLAAKVPQAGLGRLELDIPTSATGDDLDRLDRVDDVRVDKDEPILAMGTEGLLVVRDDGKAGVIVPGEIVDRDLLQKGKGKGSGLDAVKVRALLAARAGVDTPDLDAMRAYRFRADVHVESASRDAALPVFRGMVVRPAQPDVDRLIAAVRHGADYLVRILGPEGRYVYMYRALEDHDDRSYGWLRHAGTTYALLEAYEELGTPLYLQKAELALSYLRAHLHEDRESSGLYASDTTDEQEKVGGAGLSLLAFAKDAAVTGKRTELETMRALARLILKQQYPDGHFRANVDLEKDGQKLRKEPIYYPGEAALGLLRLYAIDPQPAYLDAARRAADWVLRVRDGGSSDDNQQHDHWMSYALNELYRLTRDDAYLEHAYRIARAIEKSERGDSAADPDLVGTFYQGQTTLAATRLEAFDADVALSRFAGKPDDWLLGPAKSTACHILGQQFDADNDYWLPNPAKAEGGVRESLFNASVEIDYVQHAMSAWLHLARALRDPAYGKTGVPSQDAVR